ncbi:phage portal protein, partial [Bacillus haynesii]|nr:phage portal protein [Bacillus haynesii]
MFEDQTFDEIMERMLDRVPADIDKRENSVIWNALAPAAA